MNPFISRGARPDASVAGPSSRFAIRHRRRTSYPDLSPRINSVSGADAAVGPARPGRTHPFGTEGGPAWYDRERYELGPAAEPEPAGPLFVRRAPHQPAAAPPPTGLAEGGAA
jgi:hypothetical protein